MPPRFSFNTDLGFGVNAPLEVLFEDDDITIVLFKVW
jgi:hypothetical protein